jgi:hypothetical protein
MNERIKKLAEQAGDYVNSVYNPPVRSSTPGKIWEDGHVDWHIQFNQKFAKLIVQECQFAIVSRTDLPRHERKLYNNVLKKHFGVEE